MEPIKFKGSNTILNENEFEYTPIPAFKSAKGEVVLCWKLSFKEKIKLLLKGKLFATTLTFNDPLQRTLISLDNPVDLD